ncbi:putative membrane-anchored protein [Gracilibacillus halotolerans]|uniref:Putative membrane-anchored protein n=1 Tax=Gracilibacillus halotolerans TaxID=74386 RepID=A0A841RP90_9BACI|nr:DUF3278 domain-containing protein [Gracilibacillus halotolerans]MBB6513443.1 putative membrane-anchored protein [Gracilibacillus halotolerans]
MKSWISFLLPEDEYKEKKLLYFISEGATIVILYLIVMFIMSNFFQISAKPTIVIAICIFGFYVFSRYILSGIEYTDIATKVDYKKQLRVTRIKSIGFVVLFLSLQVLFVNFPTNLNEWVDIIGMSVSGGVVLFIFEYISLKRSYEKNKDLIE